jgi:hypothetical protein
MFVPKKNGDKKNPMQIVHKLAFFGKNMEKWPYFEGKNHIMPYLDSEFLLIISTKMDLKIYTLVAQLSPLTKFGSFLCGLSLVYLLKKVEKKNLLSY